MFLMTPGKISRLLASGKPLELDGLNDWINDPAKEVMMDQMAVIVPPVGVRYVFAPADYPALSDTFHYLYFNPEISGMTPAGFIHTFTGENESAYGVPSIPGSSTVMEQKFAAERRLCFVRNDKFHHRMRTESHIPRKRFRRYRLPSPWKSPSYPDE